MAVRSPTEIEEQAEANRRKLLAAEAAFLVLLLRSRNDAVSDAVRRGYSIVGVSRQVESSLQRSLIEGRDLARRAALSRLQAEFASMGFGLARGAERVNEFARDWRRARVAARSYAQRWLRKATGETVAASAASANATTLGSVRRIGATESAEAFNNGRLATLRQASGPMLRRVWDAALDQRACPACRDADGTIVGAREPFPLGEPGSVHPLCRCSFTLVTAEERPLAKAA